MRPSFHRAAIRRVDYLSHNNLLQHHVALLPAWSAPIPRVGGIADRAFQSAAPCAWLLAPVG